jgi:hypothetical protein
LEVDKLLASASLVKPRPVAMFFCMKQLDFPNYPAGDEVAVQPLHSEQVKGKHGWIDTALWIVIIASWCGFAVLAFSMH